jgi:hypothetical protein
VFTTRLIVWFLTSQEDYIKVSTGKSENARIGRQRQMRTVSLVYYNIETIGQCLKRQVYGLALRVLVLVAVAVVVVIFSRPHAQGEVETNGTLNQITDQTGATIFQANVRPVSEETHQERQAVCSDPFDDILSAVHPGKYALTAETLGFGA